MLVLGESQRNEGLTFNLELWEIHGEILTFLAGQVVFSPHQSDIFATALPITCTRPSSVFTDFTSLQWILLYQH